MPSDIFPNSIGKINNLKQINSEITQASCHPQAGTYKHLYHKHLSNSTVDNLASLHVIVGWASCHWCQLKVKPLTKQSF